MMTRAQAVLAGLALLMVFTGCLGPLHSAARDGDKNAVLALLEQGTDVNADFGGTGLTALHFAASKGHIDIVRVLLDQGAYINATSRLRETPIKRAAEYGHLEVVKLLIERGAKTGIKGDGGTPLQIAEGNNHTAIAQLLREAKTQEAAGQSRAEPGLRIVSTPSAAGQAIRSDVDRVPALNTTIKKNAYAVVIGIEQYREKLPKADFADRDARLVGEYLTKVLGYPEENVIVRTNDRATRTDLVKYFEEWLRNNVEKDSSVFVYYSGHGAPNTKTGEAYFVPYDGDPSFVESTAYPVKQLYAALDKLPAKDITVVLDSCFSGAGGRSVLAKGARPMGLSIENATLASGKTVVLAASGGDQISNSFEEKGHGLLTYYFLKGLQGEGDANKDGAIDMAELYDYVKPNVQRVARKQYNNEQTPQLLASPELLKKGGGRLLERTRP